MYIHIATRALLHALPSFFIWLITASAILHESYVKLRELLKIIHSKMNVVQDWKGKGMNKNSTVMICICIHHHHHRDSIFLSLFTCIYFYAISQHFLHIFHSSQRFFWHVDNKRKIDIIESIMNNNNERHKTKRGDCKNEM